jgi:hypothetical protein
VHPVGEYLGVAEATPSARGALRNVKSVRPGSTRSGLNARWKSRPAARPRSWSLLAAAVARGGAGVQVSCLDDSRVSGLCGCGSERVGGVSDFLVVGGVGGNW